MGEWAPPFGTLSSPTPPHHSSQNAWHGRDKADANANHSYLGGLEGTYKNGPEGELSLSPFPIRSN
jgi:hypothetical protein